MPEVPNIDNAEMRHTDEMQDIISAPPRWIVSWGITLFFAVLTSIIGMSAFIRYPDIVVTSMKIQSPNSPKPIVAKVSGKLIRLLVKEDETVSPGVPVAYLESTGSHDTILALLNRLKQAQRLISSGRFVVNGILDREPSAEYGELQLSYQIFFQDYLNLKAVVKDGVYPKKRAYLQSDLQNLKRQEEQLAEQKAIQLKDYELAGQEFEMHKKLAEQMVETRAEFREAQSRYLTKKAPLVQTEAAVISAKGNYTAKEKEMLELDNQITEGKVKFFQALNSLISQIEEWKNKYVLSASQSGTISYAGIVQEGQVISAGQDVFYVNPRNEQFYGEMSIPQDNMGKVMEGQEVLVKLKSYPFEQFGLIRGRIMHISAVPYRDSIFLSTVELRLSDAKERRSQVRLKQGMTASAEIVTQDATILKRLSWNLMKLMNFK